ncbi:hypothetical protein F5888DRAFT_1176641 [Russula emetica]|nr:hypothetical protein F5888DRAFT_1176641 [Russula emetica]
MVRNSAWGCGCNRHHDFCTLAEFSLHPTSRSSPVGYFFSLLRSVLPSTSPLWRTSRAVVDPSLSFSVLPSFSPLSPVRTLLFRIMPSSWVFGDRVTSKVVQVVPYVSNFHSQLSDPTFSSFLHGIVLFPDHRFSRSDPIQAMAGMKIRNCHEKLFSDSLMLKHYAGLHHCL